MKNPKCTFGERMTLISRSKDTFVVAMCIYDGYKQDMEQGTGTKFRCRGRGRLPLLAGSFPGSAKETRPAAPIENKEMNVATLHNDMTGICRMYGATRILARVDSRSIVVMMFNEIFSNRIWSSRFEFRREFVHAPDFDAGQMTGLVKELNGSMEGRYEIGV